MGHEVKNLLEHLPEERVPEELFETLFKNDHLQLKRIISTGQATPVGEWYDQEQDEWVLLLKGRAMLVFENGDQLALKPGDSVFIEAHQRHRVDWTDPDEVCVWLALYVVGPLGLEPRTNGL